MSSPATFASRLIEAKYRPAGFDYLRLLLSMAVLGWHTILMTAGQKAQDDIIDHSLWRVLPEAVLPMFFALSGFLVAGSLDRTKNIIDFMGLRVLRILPALCFCVIVSAVIMGPLMTSYPLHEYVADARFSNYFLTILGDIQPDLPGVFENNPYPHIINGQLWTIPLELMCYGLLIIPAIIGIYRRPKLFLAFVIAVQLAFAARAFLQPVIYNGVPQKMLLLCFLAGTIISMFREHIPARWWLAALSLAVTFGLMYIPGGNYFIAFPAAYFTIYLGLQNPQKVWLVRSGDYSYGVYLFAFPVQQLVASIPGLPQHWFVNLALSVPLSLLMAFISWWLIEKRALTYRQYIPHLYQWPTGIYAKHRSRSRLKHSSET